MTDAQNERTTTSGRRRSRHGQRGKSERGAAAEYGAARDATSDGSSPQSRNKTVTSEDPESTELVRPPDIAAPIERIDVYCVHHLALMPDHEPINFRTNMTTLRHLAVDHFGEATLFCDCLHNGPHEWPPSLQRLETAMELDQFLTDSTSDA